MTWKWTLLTNRMKIGISFFRTKNWCRLTNLSFSPQEKILLFSLEPRLILICRNPGIGSKVFWISRLSSIDLVVWVPTRDLIQLKTWQPGEIAPSGSPLSIIRISWISSLPWTLKRGYVAPGASTWTDRTLGWKLAQSLLTIMPQRQHMMWKLSSRLRGTSLGPSMELIRFMYLQGTSWALRGLAWLLKLRYITLARWPHILPSKGRRQLLEKGRRAAQLWSRVPKAHCNIAHLLMIGASKR